MAGGVGVKANVHVEKWATMREHVEVGFKFKNRWGTLAVFAVAVPLLVYTATVGEFVRASPAAPPSAPPPGFGLLGFGKPPPRKQRPRRQQDWCLKVL
jgi:hypothetical protein